jgi:hypothetical protein
MKCWDWIG